VASSGAALLSLHATVVRVGPLDPDMVLADLFRGHHSVMVRTAALLLRDRGHAEEIVQDAYVKLHHALPRLRDETAAVGYLRATVVNLARSRLRRGRVETRHLRAPEASDRAYVEEAIVLREDQRAVLAALAELPVRQRECVVLRYWSGLTEPETAAALGISVGSVKTHCHRALAALGPRLEATR
jgi:RNA polymerase sigma-70 factor (sigma-E family)